MNMHYPIPERANHSMQWLIVVALLVAGLLLAVRTAGQQGNGIDKRLKTRAA